MQLIERIFDPEDSDLAIGLSERRQLIAAYLTNAKSLSNAQRDPMDFIDGLDSYSALEPFRKLWKLANKWPVESGVPHAVYVAVPTNESTNAEAYRDCGDPGLRSDILDSCGSADTETFELGMKDIDGNCRYIAFSRVGYVKLELVKALLEGDDKDALLGLALNESLSIETLKKVKDRLQELDDDVGVWSARKTIEDLRENRAPRDPRELFDTLKVGRGDFASEKIHAIGEELLELKDRVRDVHELVCGFSGKLEELGAGSGEKGIVEDLAAEFKVRLSAIARQVERLTTFAEVTLGIVILYLVLLTFKC